MHYGPIMDPSQHGTMYALLEMRTRETETEEERATDAAVLLLPPQQDTERYTSESGSDIKCNLYTRTESKDN